MKVPKPGRLEATLEALKKFPRGATRSQLATATGFGDGTMVRYVRILKQQEKIVLLRDGRIGVWVRKEDADDMRLIFAAESEHRYKVTYTRKMQRRQAHREMLRSLNPPPPKPEEPTQPTKPARTKSYRWPETNSFTPPPVLVSSVWHWERVQCV